MVSLLRALKDRRVRASATSTIATSAGVPNSGFTFVNNSQGASAAIAELSGQLGDALESIDEDYNDPGDQLRFQLGQLDAEAAKYINSRLDETRCRSWTCTPRDAAIINIASQCAVAAYDPQVEPNVEGFWFERHLYKPSSQANIEKASLFTVAEPLVELDRHGFYPLLVVSIRGSASVIDHIVNLNAGPQSAQDFIDLCGIQGSDSNSRNSKTIEAHGGFLDSAQSLKAEVAQQVTKAIKQKRVQHVLFTGHSAGGAVASLLFLHFLCIAASDYKTCCFSSITFGSPPTIKLDLQRVLARSQAGDHRGIVLNFANEYDLVCRASREYIRSLVDLVRSIYGLPRIQDQGTADDDRRALDSPTSSDTEGPGLIIGSRGPSLPTWELPPPDSFHIGPLVVLKAGYEDGEGNDANLAGEAKLDLRAYLIRPEEFAKLLFCRISVHTRQIYLDSVKEIAAGRLHGNEGWQSGFLGSAA